MEISSLHLKKKWKYHLKEVKNFICLINRVKSEMKFRGKGRRVKTERSFELAVSTVFSHKGH